VRKIQLVNAIAGLGALSIAGTAWAQRDVPAASTEGLSYTYLQASGVWRNLDPFDDADAFIDNWDDGRGWSLSGSYAFSDRYFIFGDYTSTDADVALLGDNAVLFPTDQDTKQLTAGFGYNRALNRRNTDFVARLAYTDFDFGDFDLGPGGPDDDFRDFFDDESSGWLVDFGVRSQLMPNLEGGVGVRHLDIGDFDNTSLFGNIMYEFHPNWGLNFETDLGTEFSTFSIGVRFIGRGRR
jgi:hypothetical protein